MADANVANALLIFTKTNTTILKRLDKIEKKVDRVTKAQSNKPEEVIAEAEPVEIDSLGKDARLQLGRLLNQQAYLNLEHQKKLNKEFEKKDKPSSIFTGMGKGLINSLMNVGGIALLGALVADILKQIFSGPGLFGFGGGIAEMKAQTKTVGRAAISAMEGLSKAVKYISRTINTSLAQIATTAATAAGDKAANKARERAGVKAIEKGEISTLEKTAEKTLGKSLEKGGAAGAKQVFSAEAATMRGGVKQLDNLVVPTKLADDIAAKAAATNNINDMFKGMKVVPPVKPQSWWEKTTSWVLEKSSSMLGPIEKALSSNGAKWLLKILKIPGLADVVFGAIETKGVIDDYLNDKLTKTQLHKQMGKVAAGALGSAIGGASGAALLAPLGGPFALLTGIAGTAAGSYAGDKIGRILTNAMEEKDLDEFGENATVIFSKLLPFMKGNFTDKYESDKGNEKINPTIKVEDGIMMPGGTIIEPHKDDTVYAMKAGGPLDKYFNNNIKETQNNTNILKKYAINSTELLSRQIDILVENNRVLKQVVDKLSVKQPSNAVTVNNNSYIGSDDNTLRNVQALYA